MSAKHRCLVPGCNNKPRSRGLCRSDYYLAWGMVKNGDTSWEKLEKLGRALPRDGEMKRDKARNFMLSK